MDEIANALTGEVNAELVNADADTKQEWVVQLLQQFDYANCSREDKGLLRKFIQQETGYFRAQTTRHVKTGLAIVEELQAQQGSLLGTVQSFAEAVSTVRTRKISLVAAGTFAVLFGLHSVISNKPEPLRFLNADLAGWTMQDSAGNDVLLSDLQSIAFGKPTYSTLGLLAAVQSIDANTGEVRPLYHQEIALADGAEPRVRTAKFSFENLLDTVAKRRQERLLSGLYNTANNWRWYTSTADSSETDSTIAGTPVYEYIDPRARRSLSLQGAVIPQVGINGEEIKDKSEKLTAVEQRRQERLVGRGLLAPVTGNRDSEFGSRLPAGEAGNLEGENVHAAGQELGTNLYAMAGTPREGQVLMIVNGQPQWKHIVLSDTQESAPHGGYISRRGGGSGRGGGGGGSSNNGIGEQGPQGDRGPAGPTLGIFNSLNTRSSKVTPLDLAPGDAGETNLYNLQWLAVNRTSSGGSALAVSGSTLLDGQVTFGSGLTLNSISYSFPGIEGGSGTVLGTDGNGNLGWLSSASLAGGVSNDQANDFYVNEAGDAMTGSLLIGAATTSTALEDGIALEVVGTMSGRSLYISGTGSNPLFVANAGTSRIGIGTSNPESVFDLRPDTSTNLTFRIRAEDDTEDAYKIHGAAGGTTRHWIYGENHSKWNAVYQMKIISENMVYTQDIRKNTANGVQHTLTGAITGKGYHFNLNGSQRLQVLNAGTTITGSGTTSATTALTIADSSSTALMIVRDDGNVGIGTTAPTAKLTVQGTISGSTLVGSDLQNCGIVVTSANGTLSCGSIANAGDDRYVNTAGDTMTGALNITAAGVGLNVSGTMSGQGLHVWNGSATPTLYTTSAGNVGIGTTTPNQKLSVAGTMSGEHLYVSGSGASPILHTNADGNVGIGTLYTRALLTVGEPTSNPTGSEKMMVQDGIVIQQTSNTVNTTANLAFHNGTSGITTQLESKRTAGGSARSDLLFYTHNGSSLVERMHIDGDGYVGIGTDSSDQALEVAGTMSGEQLYISGTGSSPLLVTNTGNSRVGIGTTAPDGKLHVYTGNSSATAHSSGDDLVIETTSDGGLSILAGSVGYIMFGDSADNNAGQITYVHSSNYMSFTANGSEAMRINSSGNLGIGTTAPTTALEVIGTGSGNALVASNTLSTPQINAIDGRGLKLFDDASNGIFVEDGGNIGIGTTAPSTKLHIIGPDGEGTAPGFGSDTAFVIQNNNNVTTDQALMYLVAGTTGDAIIAMGDSASGAQGQFRYSNNTDSLAIWTANSEQLRINSSGNVGIGTTTPNQKLSVVGTMSGEQLYISGTGSSPVLYTNGGKVGIGTTAIGDAGLAVMNGNVGINTTTPSYKFVVKGNFSNDTFYVNPTADYTLLGSDQALRLASAASTDIRIQPAGVFSTAFAAGGNVGIGSASPTTKLEVVGTISGSSLNAVTSGSNGAVNLYGNNPRIYGRQADSAGVLEIGTLNSNDISFFANNSAAMRIQAAGNVGIGTVSPAQLLEVQKDQAATTGLQLENASAADGAYARIFVRNNNGAAEFSVTGGGTTTAGAYVQNKALLFAASTLDGLNIATQGSDPITFMTNSTEVARIDANGNLGIGTTTPNQKLSVAGTMSGRQLYVSGTGSSPVLYTNGGKLGVGTSSISSEAKLHVDGMCVTGDTKLVAKAGEVQIKDIKSGTLIQSLDEKTGELVWSRVNALLDMGVKPIYKLTTKSGKTIRTTGNHPYLVRQHNRQSSSFVASLPMLDVCNTNSITAFDRELYSVDPLAQTVVSGFASQLNNMGMVSRVGQRLQRSQFLQNQTPVINRNAQQLFRCRFGVGKNPHYPTCSDNASISSADSFSSRNLALVSNCEERLDNSRKSMTSSISSLERPLTSQPNTFLAMNALTEEHDNVTTSQESMNVSFHPSQGNWQKVYELSIGNYIAVSSENGTAAWDEIVNIELLPAEQVYDIEVEGTHNFVGNGIIAHNTYLGGATTFAGNLLPSATNTYSLGSDTVRWKDLYLSGSSLHIGASGDEAIVGYDSVANLFTIDSDGSGDSEFVINSSGNVGVGTVTPTVKLDVNGGINSAAGSTSAPGITFGDANTGLEGAGNEFYIVANATRVAQINSGRITILPAGSSSYASLALNNDADTGFYSPAANTIGVTTNGSEAMRINSSGNVGIGTTAPNAELHVDSSGDSELRIEADNAAGNPFLHFLLSGGSSFSMGIDDGDSNMFKISGSTALGTNDFLKIATSGDAVFSGEAEAVGGLVAGTKGDATSTMLDVWATGSATPLRIVQDDFSNYDLFTITRTSNNGVLSIYDSSETEDVRLSTSGVSYINGGNLGIGTLTPNQKLSVAGTMSGEQLYISGTGSTPIVYTDTSNGYLGVGTSSPTAQLHVYGSDEDNVQFTIHNDDGVGVVSLATLDIYSRNPFRSTNEEFARMQFRTGSSGTEVARISAQADGISEDGGKLSFYTQPDGGSLTQRILLDADGNVGIGTNSPDELLHLNSSGLSFIRLERDSTSLVVDQDIGGIEFETRDSNSAGVGAAVLADADGSAGEVRLSFHTGAGGSASERLRIDSDGNVGIGVTNPEAHLVVASGNTSAVSELYIDTYATANYSDSILHFRRSDTGSFGSLQETTDTDDLGTIYASGINSSSTRAIAGGIVFEQEGSAGATYVPAQIQFYTATSSAAIAQRMVLNSAGNLGIGTDDPESTMQVTGGGLCVGSDANCNTDNNTEGTVYSSSTSMTTYDVAEMYPTKDTSVTGATVVSLDPNNGVFVQRATHGDKRLLGVVSLEPAVILGGFNGNQFVGEIQHAIALSGRVPVEVTTENGNIVIGDELTVSRTQSGAAMKASAGDQTIGYALQDYSGSGTGIGSGTTIQVFVTTGDVQPAQFAESGSTLVIGSELTVSGATTIHKATNSGATNLLVLTSDVAGPEDNVFRVTADGTTYSDGAYNSTGADYAEWFRVKSSSGAPRDGALESGEIVCIDVTAENTVQRCEDSADANVMGIVSTNPAFIGNNLNGADNLGIDIPGYALVGLIGQVPAKVMIEDPSGSGSPAFAEASAGRGLEIRPGDALTTASKPGYARRALPGEPTVGVALEGLDGGQGTEGVVNVLISRRNSSVTVEQVEEEIVTQIAAMEIEDEVQILVADAVSQIDISEEISSEFNGLVNGLDIDSMVTDALSRIQVGSGLGSGSASGSNVYDQLASLQAQVAAMSGSNVVSNSQVSLTDSVTANLISSHTNILAEGTVKANKVQADTVEVLSESGGVVLSSSKDGTTIINGQLLLNGVELNPGDFELNAEDSLNIKDITVQEALYVLGDVTIEGLANFMTHVVVHGNLTVSGSLISSGTLVVNTNQAGYATIPKTGTAVTVTFDQPFAYTPIVTATSNSFEPWRIQSQSQESFTIELADPAPEDMVFSWHALATSDPKMNYGEVGDVHSIEFPVDDKGYPLSSSEIWNNCIRNQVPLDVTGKPFNCNRYHDDDLWNHPDLIVEFVWDSEADPRLILPDGYVIVTITDERGMLPAEEDDEEEEGQGTEEAEENEETEETEKNEEAEEVTGTVSGLRSGSGSTQTLSQSPSGSGSVQAGSGSTQAGSGQPSTGENLEPSSSSSSSVSSSEESSSSSSSSVSSSGESSSESSTSSEASSSQSSVEETEDTESQAPVGANLDGENAPPSFAEGTEE